MPKFLVYSPLVTYETQQDWDCGEPSPGLAVRWEHSTDYRTWTLELRRDASWHDGAPFTAHDIAFTLNLWRRPDVSHWGAGPLDSVEVIDERTVRLHYSSPTRHPLNGWDVFYPRHLLEALDPTEFGSWEFWARPVGTGPYRYVRHVPKTMMEFEANPDYFDGKPAIDRLIVKWGGTPLVELLSGNVDAAYVSTLDAVRLRDDPRFQVRYNPLAGGVRLYWNHRLPHFQDARVRRALTQAIDRRELHRTLQLPGDLPITDGIHTACQFARGELGSAWPYDPDASRQLLEEAGWRDADGDGWRERSGRVFSFTADVPARWLQAPEAAIYVQDRLRQVGVRMEVQTLEGPGVLGQRLRAGEFEAAIWITPVGDHSTLFGADAAIGYENERVAELLSTAEATVDLGERDRIYEELAAIFRAEIPATYLYPKVDVYAARRGVQGVGEGDLFMHIGRLEIEEGWAVRDGSGPRSPQEQAIVGSSDKINLEDGNKE